MRKQSPTQLHAAIAISFIVAALVNSQFYAVAAQQPTIAPVRVNIGGDTTTDQLGNVWEGDDANKYYSTGNVVWACPRAISNTDNDAVYCTYRWFNQIGTPFRYTFPQITPGAYIVRLHFAELYVTYYVITIHFYFIYFI